MDPAQGACGRAGERYQGHFWGEVGSGEKAVLWKRNGSQVTLEGWSKISSFFLRDLQFSKRRI